MATQNGLKTYVKHHKKRRRKEISLLTSSILHKKNILASHFSRQLVAFFFNYSFTRFFSSLSPSYICVCVCAFVVSFLVTIILEKIEERIYK